MRCANDLQVQVIGSTLLVVLLHRHCYILLHLHRHYYTCNYCRHRHRQYYCRHRHYYLQLATLLPAPALLYREGRI